MESGEFSDDFSGLDVDDTDDQVIAYHGEQAAVALKQYRNCR